MPQHEPHTPSRAWDVLSVDVPLAPLPPEEIIAGDPRAGAVELTRFQGLEIGTWTMTAGTATDVEAEEVFIVVEGTGDLCIGSDEGISLRPGVLVQLRAGEHTHWTVHTTLRKLYLTTVPESAGHP